MYYDYATDTRIPREPEPWPENENWLRIDCGCNNGVKWDVRPLEECPRCEGRGWLAFHVRSFAICHCPGAPIIGRKGSKAGNEILDRFVELVELEEKERRKNWRRR